MRKMQKKVLNYVWLTLASLVFAVAVSQFQDPNHLAPGGVGGLAIVLSAVTPIATGAWTFIINIPILLIGLYKFKWRFLCSTVYVVVTMSVFIDFFSCYPALTSDLVLAAVAGSVLSAISLGIIFKCGATSGGTDIIVKILRQRYPHLRTSTLFLITDMMIVALSAVVFRNFDSAMYSAIAVFVLSVVLDAVLYGRDETKLIVLISDKEEEIRQRILAEDIGLTVLDGEGGFSNKHKKVILCAMQKHKYPRIEEIVKQIDPDAFLIVTSASEIYGEGYKSYFTEKL